MKTVIAVYTSTRADYGLLRPLIEKLKQIQSLELRLFVTGTHLNPSFGYTLAEIEKDYKPDIFYCVEHSSQENEKLKNLNIMSEALLKYSEALVQDRPDISIVLGDRYEALCFGIACAALGIPLIHLHGGELTFGAIDDKFRHCLTKLSEWHFVACETYRKRVIQLGENPATVFNVGALGVDNALNQKLLNQSELEKELKINIPSEFYIFTFHPETNSADFGADLLKKFLQKFEERLNQNNAFVVLTGVNNDAGSSKIRGIVLDFAAKMDHKALFVESLGIIKYLSLMKLAIAVIGNSSSGVIEAYSMGTPTINIGVRQAGRERESSVVDLLSIADISDFRFDDIINMKDEIKDSRSPSIFGNGSTSESIAKKVMDIAENLSKFDKPKDFFDILPNI